MRSSDPNTYSLSTAEGTLARSCLGKGEFLLACGSGGRVHNSRHGSRQPEQETGRSHLSHTQEAEDALEVG